MFTRYAASRTNALVAAALLAVLVLAACGGDDEGPATPTPPTTATASPTPAGTGGPSPSPTGPTPAPGVIGVPAFDELAERFVEGDIAGLVDAVRYTALACETVQGLGGPPECRPGEAEGTIVHVIPFSSCEGEYKREDQLVPLLEAQVERDPGLYAAFSLRDRGTPERPLGEYGILFRLDGPAGVGPLGLMFGVSGEGELMGIWAGCGATPADIFERFAGDEVLLEPQS